MSVQDSFPTRRSSDLAERQAKPGAKVFPILDLTELLEDAGVKRRGDTASRVHDLDARAVAPVTDTHRHLPRLGRDRKSTRLNSSHSQISYSVFCLKKK